MLLAYLTEYNRYLNLLGIGLIMLIAVIFSRNRKAINPRLVASGLLLQFSIGFIALRTEIGRRFLDAIARGVRVIYTCADEGSRFLFGNLVNTDTSWGPIFVIKVLPVIVFFSAFMSVLFYYNIVQKIVYYMSFIFRPVLGTSGAETLCAIANSFLGQTEAPLLVRRYLGQMTKSELLVVMVSGMATISGSILTIFALMGVPTVHLLTASVMAIPASIVMAKMLYPEQEESKTIKAVIQTDFQDQNNLFSAISAGTTDGLFLALNVGAMLMAFLSLLAVVNLLLAHGVQGVNSLLVSLHIPFVLPPLSLSIIFSYIFAPFGYFLGFSGDEIFQAGKLLGLKISINEFIAYGQMVLSPVSQRFSALMTYALCGFSNFSCIGIQIGGIGALVPEKKQWLCELGLLALLGASLANLLSALIAGLLL